MSLMKADAAATTVDAAKTSARHRHRTSLVAQTSAFATANVIKLLPLQTTASQQISAALQPTKRVDALTTKLLLPKHLRI
jgi:hypothetical protein